MKSLDIRVNEIYRLRHKIAVGGFGVIYLAANVETSNEEENEEQVAIKLEHRFRYPGLLSAEAALYDRIAGGVGIPKSLWFGEECDYRALVLELLGPSLENLFIYCDRRFSLKTVLMIADQLICRLQYMHSKNIIHRDIKPENFLIGTGKRGNCIYVTDLGLSVEFQPNQAPQTFPTEQHLVGTADFASISGHFGVAQSRRDDLESLGYMLLYFLRGGTLPWTKILASRHPRPQRQTLTLQQKHTTDPDTLFAGFPEEFAVYMDHVRSLTYDKKPKYAWLRRIFRNLFVREGFVFDSVFDWTRKRFLEREREREREGRVG